MGPSLTVSCSKLSVSCLMHHMHTIASAATNRVQLHPHAIMSFSVFANGESMLMESSRLALQHVCHHCRNWDFIFSLQDFRNLYFLLVV